MKYKKEMKLKGVEVRIFLLLNDDLYYCKPTISTNNTNTFHIKMPKIDTLDALDDRTTSMLKTL